MSVLAKRNEYAAVRGFNYQPGFASHGICIWLHEFDRSAIDRELGWGKKHFPGMNTVRLWLSYEAFLINPRKAAEHFHQALDAAGRYGLKCIPTLFNACEGAMPPFSILTVCQINYWCSTQERYGEMFLPYLEGIVGCHRDDDRILMWDLFNESSKDRFHFVKRIYDDIKRMGVKAPLTVGTCPNMDDLRTNDGASDVLTIHPYYAHNAWIKTYSQFTDFLDEAVSFANRVDKPILATETGWGSLDDRRRAETLAVELREITDRGLGVLIHMLCHTPVFDGHRPEYGPISEAGYMACIERDGERRKHHGVINDYFNKLIQLK